MRISVTHSTVYRFSRPVYLEPHTFRLRPRQDGTQWLNRYALEISPAPAVRTECLDQDGNAAVEAWFTELVAELTVRSSFQVETRRENPFDYILTAPPSLPLAYAGPLRAALAPYLGAANVPQAVKHPRPAHVDLPHLTGANKLDGVLEVLDAALPGADLDNALEMPGRAQHGLGFHETVRNGLLAIDVLARLAGGNEGDGMPVIGCADNDRVDVLLLQQLAEVLDLLGRRPASVDDIGCRVVQVRCVHVADGGHFDPLEPHQLLLVCPAHAAAADQAEHDPVIGATALGEDVGSQTQAQPHSAHSGAGLSEELTTGLHGNPQ